jgi:ribosomal protein L11 methyltransferase
VAALYLSLTVDLPEASSELAQSALHDAGALGLEVRDSEGPPMPGVRGPKAGEAIVVAYFDGREAAFDALAMLGHEFPEARARIEDVPTQDWSNAWKALIRSVEIGRLWVGPPWDVANAPAGKARVVIEPKMAFGTGDHPTTSLCLAAVDRFLVAHPGASVLDVGTGTGVLAIAARKLGAGRVVGVDNDEMSVTLANENAVANAVVGLELSGKTLEQVTGPFDLVVANILANTLVALAPAIAAKTGKQLVLAGVLVPQQAEVEAAYRAQGLVPEGQQTQGDWIRLDFKRP